MHRDQARKGQFEKALGRALTVAVMVTLGLAAGATPAQEAAPSPAGHARPEREKPRGRKETVSRAKPKLVVLLVVDQMRADYVDKFLGEWSGGLKRLVEEGAWFHEAAYPYAATETCVGHSTIASGALPATHGMVANAWWDRQTGKLVTCTEDAAVKNIGYAGLVASGGDSAARMAVPAFAEELKFQSGRPTRVVTFSLKARAAIAMAGHKADAVTWLDGRSGAWTTSSAYPQAPFVEDYARAHPVKEDMGKSWTLSLPRAKYLYDEKTTGAVAPDGWELTFPHVLRGKGGSAEADEQYYEEWSSSPFAETYLTRLAEQAVDALELGRGKGTDFLGVSYSSVDYVGHAFGPRSWEMQDILLRLDRDLGQLFAHLDETVGRGNYVVALSADHGAVPVPEDLEASGVDAGVLHVPEFQARIEKALDDLGYPKPAIARMTYGEVYFSPGVYERLRADGPALRAVGEAARAVPGVASIFTAEEIAGRPATEDPIRAALAAGYFAGRSGDMFFVPKPYWLIDGTAIGKARHYGTGHGTPYYYDQHVPLLLMGSGVRGGDYYRRVTPADIAPTFAALCGITLASRDGQVLGEALGKAGPR
ncbi:MAG: alkaline phosphatase family protein [Candidatus Acidiferrum sp.]